MAKGGGRFLVKRRDGSFSFCLLLLIVFYLPLVVHRGKGRAHTRQWGVIE